MFEKIKLWLTAPTHTNEERSRVARWLHVILLGVIGGAFFIMVSSFLSNSMRVMEIGEVVLVFALVSYWLNKRGALNVSTFLLLLILIGSVTYSALTGFGVHDVIIVLYPVILVIGGMILRPALFWVLTFLSIVSVGVVVFSEVNGWVVTPFQDLTDPTDFAIIASILFVQSLTVGLLTNNLMQSLGKARLENAERRRAEAERERLIQELGRRNVELERYVYTVSHELKTPIVTIKGFLGSIADDIEKGKFEHVQGDFQRIGKAADNMNNTLSDLLEYSRVGHTLNAFDEVDLLALAREVVDVFGDNLQAKKIQVSISPDLPTVRGDRVRLREVFSNLIDNAIKYAGDQPAPVIKIGQREDGNRTVIYVEDNGPGIAPQYHRKIFSLFEKLDPSSDGTGIGLSLVKSIVEAHGGTVWVESDGKGRGAGFCFTLPQNKE